MTWFSLPVLQANNAAAFFDSDSAARWLAGQPQTNAGAMLASLVAQLEAFNAYGAAPCERFETLEVLRKTLFAVSAEGRKRYEYKPVPLLPAEQSVFDSVLRLWRACTVAYLHCLRACLDRDPSIAVRSALVTHRVLSCLRMQQINCYVVAAEPSDDFWRTLHAVWASAEQLGVERQPVADRLLGETHESTASGQYCMALLLHLARPHGLSRGQLTAATRWLSRWREQARVLGESEASQRSAKSGKSLESVKSRYLALDLSSDRPIADPLRAAGVGRWLSLGAVLRKMGERVELLASGQSPEELKLGSGLSGQECAALLDTLADHLQHPPSQGVAELVAQGESVVLAAGLENVYRLLGGASIKDLLAASTSSFASHLVVEQIAVFGHAVRETDHSSERAAEIWRLIGQDAGELLVTRTPASGEARLVFGDLLAIRLPRREACVLATVSALRAPGDGRLCVSAGLLPGKPVPLLAEVREKPAGKVSRHAVVLLAAENGTAAQLVIPAGLAQRALSMRFFDAKGQPWPGLRLAHCIAHGGDSERWAVDE